MGSLVVKLDNPTTEKLKNRFHYSDVDMLNFRSPRLSDVPMSYDVEAVKLSIRNILMWRVGESILRPDFGHKLQLSMYSQMDQFNQNKVCEEIQRAIEENEPRVNIKAVAAKPDEDNENALRVRVAFTVIGNKTDGAEFVEQTTILGK